MVIDIAKNLMYFLPVVCRSRTTIRDDDDRGSPHIQPLDVSLATIRVNALA